MNIFNEFGNEQNGINIDAIDIEKLRKDLINHFTAAMFIASPVALMDLTEVENASDEQVVKIALDNGFNLKKYFSVGR